MRSVKEHKKPIAPIRLVLQLLSLLLCITLTVGVIASVLISDLRALTSSGGIRTILESLTTVTANTDDPALLAPLPAANGLTQLNATTGEEESEEEDSEETELPQLSAAMLTNPDALAAYLQSVAQAALGEETDISVEQVQTFITSIISGFSFALGQMFHTNRERFMKVYNVYETFYIMATFIIYTLMAVFLLPLIQIYTSGITDAEYTNVYLVILFVVMNLLANGKLPSNHVLEYSGKFEETRSHAIWEMIINITVSVAAILAWGICGAIVGTIVALLYRGAMMIYYSNKRVLERGIFRTYKLWLVNGAAFALIMWIFFVDSFSGLSFISLVIKGIIHSLWIIPLYVAVNLVFCREAFKNLFELRRVHK